MSNHSRYALAAGGVVAAALATPVLAHPGPHDTMTFTQLAAHFSSGWHLVLLLAAIALATGVVLLANHRRQAPAPRRVRNRRDQS